jgi:C4-dicarboxylate-specific signal transduction histidine kinase
VWAENCPENFANRAALVGAEMARLEGRELDVERLYEEAIRRSAALVIADGHRAADIMSRIRALATKAPPHKDWLDLKATIWDTLALVRSEVHRHRIVLETHLAADVPRILGDRIQLQQVLLNLMMNAIEAMSRIPFTKV